MALKIEKLPVPITKLGEGPHWDTGRQTLFYVDLMAKYLNRYVPATKEHAMAKVDTENYISFIIPVAGKPDQFVANTGHKIYILRWDGRNDSKVEFLHELAELDMEHPPNIINDGKVDPGGRLFTGTIGIPENFNPETSKFTGLNNGSFYSITGEGVVKKHYSGVKASNGIAFDLRRKAVYHNDTFNNVIRRLDYDVETGETTNKATLFDYKAANVPGYPDGMTIDTDGNLWVASYEGSSVLKINPDTGKVIQTLEIPAKEVTSVTFGGADMDVLYVTTGRIRVGNDEAGGETYAVTGLGVRGTDNLSFDWKINK